MKKFSDLSKAEQYGYIEDWLVACHTDWAESDAEIYDWLNENGYSSVRDYLSDEDDLYETWEEEEMTAAKQYTL